MPERCAGIVVVGDGALIVDASVPDDGPITIIADHKFVLQQGDKPAAYARLKDEIVNYIREHNIEKIVVKGSALPTGSTKLAHLESAEVRGVVISSAASVARTLISKKAALSKSFGKRLVDDYLADDDFWSEEISDTSVKLRKGSREAALLILANRN